MTTLRSVCFSSAVLTTVFLVRFPAVAQTGKSPVPASTARSAYQINSAADIGGSLFLGDQVPGQQNGHNTVAGIGTGGALTAGSTGYGGQFNTFLGSLVAPKTKTARESVCIGASACYSLIGSDSGVEDSIVTVIGSQAMASMANDVLSSTFVGQKSGLDLQHSYYDIFIGNHSGVRVNRSVRSTFMGGFVAAGDILGTVGQGSDVTYNSYDNTVIGGEAAEFASSNADKRENVIVGSQAMPSWGAANGNSVVGFQAGRRITNGTYNTCVGWYCLFGASGGRDVTTTGTYNVAMGAMALPSVSTGNRNVAVGYYTGSDLTTGSDNLLFGANVGNTVKAGNQNILFGGGAGNTSNFSNVVALGWSSCISPDSGMVCIGSRAGANNAGTGNMFIGRNAGQNISSGSNNLVIGQDALQYTYGTESGNTVIGNNAQIDAGCNNTVQIGAGQNHHCGTVQLGPDALMNSKGELLTKGFMLLPSEIFHITTDGTTTITRTLANYTNDASVTFGARNATAAANMSGVYTTQAVHGVLMLTVPAVIGMQFDVTVTQASLD